MPNKDYQGHWKSGRGGNSRNHCPYREIQRGVPSRHTSTGGGRAAGGDHLR
ncbi:hypothetical protein D187_005272 [Cystobacter fuscus DSM 2262]|uniref:Uncharacterized protein n=1 Tax=Cystobacter fuscus (strain ATCC 25194 / DSM 2262 / NBRC 100088 / M29) TaxID=1242864 RepID=S9R5C0_CYSF2|nr:hypothetical protein D187_005272 [Cystobacter fuscus DSM 2262]